MIKRSEKKRIKIERERIKYHFYHRAELKRVEKRMEAKPSRKCTQGAVSSVVHGTAQYVES